MSGRRSPDSLSRSLAEQQGLLFGIRAATEAASPAQQRRHAGGGGIGGLGDTTRSSTTTNTSRRTPVVSFQGTHSQWRSNVAKNRHSRLSRFLTPIKKTRRGAPSQQQKQQYSGVDGDGDEAGHQHQRRRPNAAAARRAYLRPSEQRLTEVSPLLVKRAPQEYGGVKQSGRGHWGASRERASDSDSEVSNSSGGIYRTPTASSSGTKGLKHKRDAATASMQRNGIVLPMFIIVSCIVAVGNSLSWKLMLDKFNGDQHNLEFFVSQVTVFFYVVCTFCVVLYKLVFTNDITAEQRKFPLKLFLVMACYDSISGLCSAVGGANTSGQNQTLINQLTIPFTMILSYTLLTKRYSYTQVVGATMIMLGASIGAFPVLFGDGSSGSPSSSSAMAVASHHHVVTSATTGAHDIVAAPMKMTVVDGFYDDRRYRDSGSSKVLRGTGGRGDAHYRAGNNDDDDDGDGMNRNGSSSPGDSSGTAATSPTQQQGQPPAGFAYPWYGTAVFVIGVIPGSLSNVYKESKFKADNLDVYYLTTWVSALQVLIGFCFTPILSLRAFGGTALKEIPDQFVFGWECFTGQHVDGFECDVKPYPYVYVFAYVVINLVYTILLLLIVKHGSALLMVISSALSLPIINIMFTSKAVMGSSATKFNGYDIGGLIMVLIGFLMYSLIPDAETGEFMPAQGPAGQLMYIKELKEITPMKRSKSFSIGTSPIFARSLRDSPRMLAKSVPDLPAAEFTLSALERRERDDSSGPFGLMLP